MFLSICIHYLSIEIDHFTFKYLLVALLHLLFPPYRNSFSSQKGIDHPDWEFRYRMTETRPMGLGSEMTVGLPASLHEAMILSLSLGYG